MDKVCFKEKPVLIGSYWCSAMFILFNFVIQQSWHTEVCYVTRLGGNANMTEVQVVVQELDWSI